MRRSSSALDRLASRRWPAAIVRISASEPRLAAKFPTGALASFALAAPWARLGEAETQLTAYVVPRELP